MKFYETCAGCAPPGRPEAACSGHVPWARGHRVPSACTGCAHFHKRSRWEASTQPTARDAVGACPECVAPVGNDHRGRDQTAVALRPLGCHSLCPVDRVLVSARAAGARRRCPCCPVTVRAAARPHPRRQRFVPLAVLIASSDLRFPRDFAPVVSTPRAAIACPCPCSAVCPTGAATDSQRRERSENRRGTRGPPTPRTRGSRTESGGSWTWTGGPFAIGSGTPVSVSELDGR